MRLYRQAGEGLAGCKHRQFTFVWQAGSLHLEEHGDQAPRCERGCKNEHLKVTRGSVEAVEVDGG